MTGEAVGSDATGQRQSGDGCPSPAIAGLRRVRLNAWIHDPRGDLLEGINYKNAVWSAPDIVRLSGIYEDSAAGRRACLNDLQRLVADGEIVKWGNDSNTRWSINFWDRALERRW